MRKLIAILFFCLSLFIIVTAFALDRHSAQRLLTHMVQLEPSAEYEGCVVI